MLVLKDCDIEVGDILFLVSSSTSLMMRFKRALQAFTTSRRKHGHMEVVSVFVCTGGSGGKDSLGYEFYNHERKLVITENTFLNNLYDQPIEELPSILRSYCLNKKLSAEYLKQYFNDNSLPPWMQALAAQIEATDTPEIIVEKILKSTLQEDEFTHKYGLDFVKRRKIIDLIYFCWQKSGHCQTLPKVNSSLLVFRFTEPTVRDRFVAEYRRQILVTESYRQKGKNRTSLWQLLLSIFGSADQDNYDSNQQSEPYADTFCAQNIIQTLNKVDPSLVNRGRRVTPKSLEAGMREATKAKLRVQPAKCSRDMQEKVDFDIFLSEEIKRNPLPPFRMMILPVSGKELMNDLIAVIGKEISRMRKKRWPSEASLRKVNLIEEELQRFIALNDSNYPIPLQVDKTLAFLHHINPLLQRKTGWFGSWISASSYAHIRAFARKQGIFDGDLRYYGEELTRKAKKNPFDIEEKKAAEDVALENYLFTDWSFSFWSPAKRALVLKQLFHHFDQGNKIYVWNGKEKRLEQVFSKATMEALINQSDLDNLWADKITPATREQIQHYARIQEINHYHLMDYASCNELEVDKVQFKAVLQQAVKLFTPEYDAQSLKQTKLSILAIEIKNALMERSRETLEDLRLEIEQEPIADLKRSTGIDTKASTRTNNFKPPLFKPVDPFNPIPSTRYYRSQVYTDLVIKEHPNSEFDYFELGGMEDLSDLHPVPYVFHAKELSKEQIKERKKTAEGPLFLGDYELKVNSKWQALPSLCRGERLLDLHLNGLQKGDFELQYSPKTALYFIRSLGEEAKKVKVKCLLQMPKGYNAFPSVNTITSLEQYPDIHKLLMKYFRYGKDEKKLREAVDLGLIHNGMDYLNEVRRLGVGSCRLRAIAFKEEMSRLHPHIPVCININTYHCYIEMKIDDQWQRYCLGGFRNVPTRIESFKQSWHQRVNSVTDTLHGSTHCFWKESSCSTALQTSNQAKSLFDIN